MASERHTTQEISESWDLWNEFVNPGGAMERHEWEKLTTRQKNQIQKACFPAECEDVDDGGRPIPGYYEQ